MARFLRKRSAVGQAPGSISYSGPRPAHTVGLQVIDYTATHLDERPLDQAQDAFRFKDEASVTWLNIDGVHEEAIIQELGTHFGIHPLVLEDIVHPWQRPKVEFFDTYIYVTLKMLTYDVSASQLKNEQVSLVWGKGWLLSFQEHPGDVFEPVRNRLRNGQGRIRGWGADYLAYALIDTLIDHYFVVLEQISERTETVEEQLLEELEGSLQQDINTMRRSLIGMRRHVWPVRELVSQLERSETPLITKQTRLFLRDAYDHAVQTIDLVESLRDVLSGLMDLFMTTLSNRMNEVMKVLTVMGSIFIPLTFIAGIYGMNFANMPELQWPWGYPVLMGVMVVMAAGLLLYFKRKNWIG